MIDVSGRNNRHMKHKLYRGSNIKRREEPGLPAGVGVLIGRSEGLGWTEISVIDGGDVG